MKKKKSDQFRWTYRQSVLKQSEGGPGTSTLKRAFKSKPIKGIRVEFVSSCYVGQTAFGIYATTKSNLRKAAAVLKEYGYIRSIKEAVQGSEDL